MRKRSEIGTQREQTRTAPAEEVGVAAAAAENTNNKAKQNKQANNTQREEGQPQ
jgi:hypothetical protein